MSWAYYSYGLRLASDWRLPYPDAPAPYTARVALRRGSTTEFARALGTICAAPAGSGAWSAAALPDGATYLKWTNVFDFIVSRSGRVVTCCPTGGALSTKAFHTHLGPSLSFALINLGVEPLHSTTVIVDGKAVALMGDCGYGKSSLGASFVKAGHRILTDDLLVLRPSGGTLLGYAGAPRVKLFPAIARVIFGAGVRGLRLEPLSSKLIIPLNARRHSSRPAPLSAIYVMRPPAAGRQSSRVSIRRLPRRSACLELVRNTFNMAVTTPERLHRQLDQAAALARSVPVKSLSYPREFRMLDEARDAILADLEL